MSYRDLPPESAALRDLFREIDDRLDALEQGKATAGQASFGRKIRVGDAYLIVTKSGTTVTVALQNALTGAPPIVIATL